jgi:L-fuculose-phosphate aldolase
MNIRKELIKYGKLLYAERFVIGAGGNISARVKNKIYIKASGVSLGNSTDRDYNKVDLVTGKASCSKKPCSVEIPMHLACYRARPDIGAAIHTHPVYGTVVGKLAKKVGFVSYEFMCAFKSEVPVVSYKSSGSLALASAVGKAIKKNNAVLLKNHGAMVVGKDIKEAYERSLVLERACRACVLSKISGKTSLIPKSELKKI